MVKFKQIKKPLKKTDRAGYSTANMAVKKEKVKYKATKVK